MHSSDGCRTSSTRPALGLKRGDVVVDDQLLRWLRGDEHSGQLVISPLIALQRDQLRSIAGRRLGTRQLVAAAMLNSSQRVHERQETLTRPAEGDLDFLRIGAAHERRGAGRGGGEPT